MTLYYNGDRYYNYMFNQSVVESLKSIDNDLYICSEFIEEIDSDKLNLSGHSKELYKAVPIIKINSISKIFKAFKSNKQVLTEAILKADHIIIRVPSSIANTAFKICKKYKKPFLTEIVGCPWDTLRHHSFKGKLMAPYMYFSTSHIIKNSKYCKYVTKEFLQKRYPTKGKNINCSDVNLPETEESVLNNRIRKINNIKNKIILGTIGSVDVKYKGQEYVLKAISKLNSEGYDFQYHLVGGGNTAYLRSVAEKYNISDKIIFKGSLSNDKVLEWLDEIDIYIHPSLTEGLSRAIIEALSRACPVTGSVYGGTPELINKKYIFKSKNVNQIYDILKNFNIEVMREEAERSFNLAKEYSPETLKKRKNDFDKMFIASEGSK